MCLNAFRIEGMKNSVRLYVCVKIQCEYTVWCAVLYSNTILSYEGCPGRCAVFCSNLLYGFRSHHLHPPTIFPPWHLLQLNNRNIIHLWNRDRKDDDRSPEHTQWVRPSSKYRRLKFKHDWSIQDLGSWTSIRKVELHAVLSYFNVRSSYRRGRGLFLAGLCLQVC